MCFLQNLILTQCAWLPGCHWTETPIAEDLIGCPGSGWETVCLKCIHWYSCSHIEAQILEMWGLSDGWPGEEFKPLTHLQYLTSVADFQPFQVTNTTSRYLLLPFRFSVQSGRQAHAPWNEGKQTDCNLGDAFWSYPMQKPSITCIFQEETEPYGDQGSCFKLCWF